MPPKGIGPGALAGAAEAGNDSAEQALDTKTLQAAQLPGAVLRKRQPTSTRPKSDPRNRTYRKPREAYHAWLAGKSWVPHTAELLASPAWQNRSKYAVRFINLLELEHTRHNGLENAFLKLTWLQMRKAGIGSNYITDTIAEVEASGLVTVTHRGSYAGGSRNNPSTYQLNYLPWKFVPATGAPVYFAPNDEWAKYQGKSARPKSSRITNMSGPFQIRRGDQTEVPKVISFPRRSRNRGPNE